MEDSLQCAAAMRQPTLEYHFHCTHDDLGFGIGIGAFELETNACQADKVRLMGYPSALDQKSSGSRPLH